MRILREAGEPDLSFSEDGSIVRVRFPFRARFACPMTYLVQWSCGSRVVQSEWKPWPSGGEMANIVSVPDGLPGDGRHAPLLSAGGSPRVRSRSLLVPQGPVVGPGLTWERVEDCTEPALA